MYLNTLQYKGGDAMPNVIWKPQPAQVRFMSRKEYECLYGGAA